MTRHDIILLAVSACCVIGAFIGGRFSVPPKIITVEKEGKIVYRDRVLTVHETNIPRGCEAIAAERDMFYQEYLAWLFAKPVNVSVTPSEIHFTMRSNQYAIEYQLHDVPVWHFAPLVSGRVSFPSNATLAISAGAGVMLDYAGTGGGIIVNGIYPYTGLDVSAFAYLRF